MPKIIKNPKEVILKEAKEIIKVEGYKSLTMRRVSDKTDIAVGTLYNYFPTKKDLIVQLMEDYWYDYLSTIEEIDEITTDIFLKLKLIYQKLETFLETFKEFWLKNYTSGYDEDSLKRKNIFTEILVNRLEVILCEAQSKGDITLFIDSSDISKFIMLNFFMMAQMNTFKYKSFEKILKKLLQN